MGLAAPTHASSAAQPLVRPPASAGAADHSQVDQALALQARVRAALADGLRLQLVSERMETTRYGRKDLVLVTDAALDRILAEMRRRYRSGKRLDGYRVAGYGHQYATDSWTITLEGDRGTVIVEASREGDGSRLAIWGGARGFTPAVVPMRPLPRRVLRTSRGVVRR